MSPLFKKWRRDVSPAQPQMVLGPEEVHQMFCTNCHCLNYELHRLCGSPIAIALDMGPTIFRCPGCDSLWCVDPISKDGMAVGISVIEFLPGHRIEVFDQSLSRPILDAWRTGDEKGRSFLNRKQGHDRMIYRAG